MHCPFVKCKRNSNRCCFAAADHVHWMRDVARELWCIAYGYWMRMPSVLGVSVCHPDPYVAFVTRGPCLWPVGCRLRLPHDIRCLTAVGCGMYHVARELWVPCTNLIAQVWKLLVCYTIVKVQFCSTKMVD